jgi:hypothetical protein
MDKKMKQRNYTQSVLKAVCVSSGSVCAKCKRSLVLEDNATEIKQIGEIAHIYPFGEVGAPRYDEIEKDGFNEKLADKEVNLILLCPSCHTEIDKAPQKYSAKALIKMKEDHKKWLQNKLSDAILNVSYNELDVICKAIANSPKEYNYATDYTAIDINEKISKNNLSDKTYNLMQLGMLKTRFVHDYLNTQINATFADDLLSCIKNIYNDLCKTTQGDELFSEMLSKMNAGIEQDLYKQAAGIAVLTYFFHICEIFEK